MKIKELKNLLACHCYEYQEGSCHSERSEESLKIRSFAIAQDDKLNLNKGKLYSFIVVRVRMVILSAAENLRCAQDDKLTYIVLFRRHGPRLFQYLEICYLFS